VGKVYLAPEADADLTAIFEYLLGAEELEVAERLVAELEAAVQSLSAMPERGKYPPELLSAGVTLFRELQCSPWRIFYRVVDDAVWSVAVLDGRRYVAQLLPERLIR
jgi:plasmid stabilization system protein ParE